MPSGSLDFCSSELLSGIFVNVQRNILSKWRASNWFNVNWENWLASTLTRNCNWPIRRIHDPNWFWVDRRASLAKYVAVASNRRCCGPTEWWSPVELRSAVDIADSCRIVDTVVAAAAAVGVSASQALRASLAMKWVELFADNIPGSQVPYSHIAAPVDWTVAAMVDTAGVYPLSNHQQDHSSLAVASSERMDYYLYSALVAMTVELVR